VLVSSIAVALATIVLAAITAYYAKMTNLLLRETAIGRLMAVVPVLIDNVSEPDDNLVGTIDNVGGKKAVGIRVALEARKWEGGVLFSTHGLLDQDEVQVDSPVAFKGAIPHGMDPSAWTACLSELKGKGILRVSVQYSDVFGRECGMATDYYGSGTNWKAYGRTFSGLVATVQDIDVLLPEWLRQGRHVSLPRRMYVAVLPHKLRMAIRVVRKRLWPDHFPEESWR
jgi:hypothetical protein